MFAPNTYLIGAQKSGTTFLASLLDQHPDVCVCDPKEPQFFTTHFESGRAAYEASFRNRDAKVTLDASTNYTFLRPFRDMESAGAPGLLAPVPERIRDVAPEARFVYIMRDPVDRAISAFRHNMRNSPQSPERKQQLASGVPLSLAEELERDPMLELVSRYADQIERYLAVFPGERFLFLSFADLTAKPDDVLRTCADFLGIDPDPLRGISSQGETHAAHKPTALGRWIRTRPGLVEGLRRVMPRGMRHMVSNALLRRPAEAIRFHDKGAVSARFVDEKARVAALTGVAL